MYQTIPYVEDGTLYQPETVGDPIEVGAPAWYDWLEQHATFSFVDGALTFTARKSMLRSGGSSWKASYRRQNKLYCIHLGHTKVLTLERLHAAAQTLAAQFASVEPNEVGQAVPTAGSPNSLMHTKLYRPVGGSDVIPRTRLIGRLNTALSGKATLVCAPAGFGKTTLLAEWVQTIARPTAWLSLDEHDNELALFVTSLVAALHTIFPDAFAATTSILSAPHLPPLHRIATLLINDLTALPKDIVVVLDDYHSICNRDVHTLLQELITYLPPQVHLVLTSRFEPPLPLAAWLVKGYMLTVNHVDLRFTLEETEAFLALALGDELAHETAVALEECTEGWIAVVRMAALSLRGTSNAATFMERLRNCSLPSISRYLLEEVFDQQTPFVQTLLEQVSILEQCCTELCVAISGEMFPHEQVHTTLEALARSHLLLVPLDDRQGWYRFHHLCGGLLQQRLREHSSAEEIATLHRRASSWYAQQGLIEEALRHAMASGDAPGAAKLVEAHFRWALEQEGWVQMERWLRFVPEEHVRSSPCLLLARAWIVQSHGLITDLPQLLTAVERLLESSYSDVPDRADSMPRLLHAVMAICWCQFQYFTGHASASLESAQRALRWNPPGEEYLASLALMYLALSQQATGQEVVALVTLQEALLDHATRQSSTARLLFAHALVFLAAGKLHQVEQIARHLLRLAQQADLAMSHYWAHFLLGTVQYEWNNLDEAISHFSVVVTNQDLAHAWTVQEAMYGLALAYQAQGLDVEAQKTARSLLDFVQEQHSQRDLRTAYTFYGQLTLLQEGAETAEPWLGMTGEQEELVGPMTSLEVPSVTCAWLLLAKGGEANVAQAYVILSRLLQYVEAIHSTRKTIQVLALAAWAYKLQGRKAEALKALESALVLARPGGFIRTFADLPALFPLLQRVRTRRGEQQVIDQKKGAYLKRILVAMNPEDARLVLREELLRQEGLEP